MIIRERNGALRTLFAIRGSILPKILPQIAAMFALGAAVAAARSIGLIDPGPGGVAPMALLGLALSVFLGFCNNAAYERWWEARKQWGRLITEIRALLQAGACFLPPEHPARRALGQHAMAFAHALRGALRREDPRAEIAGALEKADADAVLSANNPPAAILMRMAERIGDCRRENLLDIAGAKALDERLSGLAATQAACERIAGTPLPFAYTLLLQRTAYLYCLLLPFALVGAAGWATPVLTAIVAYTLFGLDALSEELEDPFGEAPNDLALDAMCRTIEISVCEAFGDTPPEPLTPIGYRLS